MVRQGDITVVLFLGRSTSPRLIARMELEALERCRREAKARPAQRQRPPSPPPHADVENDEAADASRGAEERELRGTGLSWTGTVRVRVRLVGDGVGGREARLEGLGGGTRVAEVLRLAAASLGVPAGAELAVRSAGARLLRGEETLAEAGVPREGGVVEVLVWVGEGGGGLWRLPGWMVGRRRAAVVESTGGPGNLVFGPGFRLRASLCFPDHDPAPADGASVFAPPPPEEGLAGAVVGLLGQLEGDVAGIEGAVARLNATPPPLATPDDLHPQGGPEALIGRQAEAEARWAEERRALAEADADLRAEVERLRTRLEQANSDGREEVRRCVKARDAMCELKGEVI